MNPGGTDEIAGYLPIADYGAIGNLRTVALVARTGSIDWCCMPRFDAPSLFGAILDRRRGGRFRISPVDRGAGDQEYLPDTNILRTEFRGASGHLRVTDWMPIRGDVEGKEHRPAATEIRRLVECTAGTVEVEVEWSPRFDYARAETVVHLTEQGAIAEGGGGRATLRGLSGEKELIDDGFGPSVRARWRMQAGGRVALGSHWGVATPDLPVSEALECCTATAEAWRRWVERGQADESWTGEWRDLIVRSALALKLLIHERTGAILAAPTTSLPEEIGGVRNWDYRYSWLRDSLQTAEALFALGHARDARDYVNWLEETARGENPDELHMRVIYSIEGEHELPERELPHLEGYRGSRPVRIGNAAASQRQHDIYGELVEAAFRVTSEEEELSPGIPEFLGQVVDAACAVWHHPDHGIWEERRGKHHYVHSKVMLWVALDRGVQLCRSGRIPGDVDRWSRTAKAVRSQVLDRGYDPDRGSFVQAFGSRDLDAATLLIPLHEFLPASDPRVQGTIDRILDELTVDGLVYRYRAADGLPGGEGTFGVCTFWMVNALALSGRIDEAREMFDGMAARANHVGLFSEQIDPRTGAFLGNFPQAFTHIGLISSALYLAHAEGRRLPIDSLRGTREHRRMAGRAEDR